MELETHPIFSSMPREVDVLTDGREVWIYANCNAHGVCCRNEFLVNGPVVEGYRPLGRCYTDCSAEPASTAGICQASESEEETSAERRRGVLRYVGAGLSILGGALSGGQAGVGTRNDPVIQSSAPMPLRQTTAATSSTCSSDYDCGFGNRCVKPNFSSQGTCMRSVNEYGGPSTDAPRPESVMPKFPNQQDCTTFADCPMGFHCDWSSGACVR
jgi:hypothetical protein